ncbi:DUF2989 domain-containing protein [Pseudoalteromonas sp. Scap03]|uniref:DUF2989 domain-containing protein n=1 Tax=unclassified Pseudoalteromonas TaxID=194690 RepID=UPI0015C1BA60|nr:MULTISPECIES: DUF2989 domain-containing protein [unclassified Pseudoalteromonas]NWL15938.1 DUF2989 domain-containing protein [Pseudoalteromonas sp. Scap03]QLE81075.1 DUF2989 domain-containing protein [Pseudoalteromonas sp. Scap25]QLE89018.1 DUF2989 domain-containing protein [Pseudoalteromonas sp. Scap06]
MAFKHITLTFALLLAGCEESFTVEDICVQSPAMCNDLNHDSHCKALRERTIFSRYRESLQPADENKYQLLKAFEHYNQCIGLAANIQHIKLKGKTTARRRAYLTSNREMARIYQQTHATTHPGLLYYHWSRNNDETALTRLLALENTPAVETSAEMQFYLASYYIKVDEQKAIGFLYNTLALNQAKQIPDPEIYTSLISLFYKHRQYKHAYIFAKIAELSGIKNIDILLIEQQLIAQGKNLESLDALAEQTLHQINQGKFISPRK